eukprot:3277188-Lingulodinium_polyedra.AAC.1
MPRRAPPCHVTPCRTVLRHAAPRCAVARGAPPCHAVLRRAMPRRPARCHGKPSAMVTVAGR